MKLSKNNFLLGCVITLVKRTERLVSLSYFDILHAPLASTSLLMWYYILWFFFLILDLGVDAFLYTASLSQKMSVYLSMGTPNILSLYPNAAISSTEFFVAVNSDPNVDVSTPFPPLLWHVIGYMLYNIRHTYLIDLQRYDNRSWRLVPQTNTSSTYLTHLGHSDPTWVIPTLSHPY